MAAAVSRKGELELSAFGGLSATGVPASTDRKAAAICSGLPRPQNSAPIF